MTETIDTRDTLSTLSDQLADAVEHAGRAVVQVNGRPRHPSSGVVWSSGTDRHRTAHPPMWTSWSSATPSAFW